MYTSYTAYRKHGTAINDVRSSQEGNMHLTVESRPRPSFCMYSVLLSKNRVWTCSLEKLVPNYKSVYIVPPIRLLR